MKRAIIRGLWGIKDKAHRSTASRYKIDNEISSTITNKFREPFITYVFGKENYDFITKTHKENVILLDDNPAPFDQIKYQFRNKLSIIQHAMENDGYDEVLWMDWDCVQIKKFPSNYWDIFNKKEFIQANLMMYNRKKCNWRKESLRKVPNGGFLYMRDKTIPSKIIKIWEELGMCDNDEPAVAKYMDTITGGWQGMDKYWELFEAPFCNLKNKCPYPKELIATKDVCVIHCHG